MLVGISKQLLQWRWGEGPQFLVLLTVYARRLFGNPESLSCAHVRDVMLWPPLFCQEGLGQDDVHERQQQLLVGLPEFCVKDMALWFKFVAVHRPALLQGLQVQYHYQPTPSPMLHSD